MEIQLPVKDKWNSPKVDAQYDPGFVAYLGLIFNPQRPCVDIGANVGKVSRFLAMRTNCRIYAFEPAPSTFTCLKENVKSFPNIVASELALGHVSGKFAFVGDGTVTGHLSDGKRGEPVGVNVAPLDSVIPSNEDIGLIKIDVEGNEASVLIGSEKTIFRTRPLVVVEVIDGHLQRFRTSRKDIFSILAKTGYTRAVNKYGMPESVNKPTGASDIFFLPDRNWYAPNLSIGYNRIWVSNDS